MLGYLRIEVARSLRDPRYLALAVVAPIGFYLLFAGLFGQGQSVSGLSTKVALMVSMGVYGAMWAVLSATGPRIAQERSVGWLRQLRLLPVRSDAVLVARLLAAMILAGPTIVLVFITAALTHGVTLDAWKWVALLGLLWIGVAPIAVLGIAIGYATNAEAAFGILYGIYMAISALGGLWMPLTMLPSSFQTLGKLLPSYRAADLGWRLVSGHSFNFANVLVLLAWGVVFSLAALYFAGRVARTR
ncbi:MAG TPA: ABC transporter permease [Ktedonobacterales bacterium]|nr:ABC transporter permease [Ktedonobacterales bacterium]